ncbi:DUF3574 domain-containing protein, partial [Streptomyces sp. SID1328]|nr:DUF3574 domain-containing protein [Streptomyces sp. SID1328]
MGPRTSSDEQTDGTPDSRAPGRRTAWRVASAALLAVALTGGAVAFGTARDGARAAP